MRTGLKIGNRGQAATEYAIVSAAIFGFLILGTSGGWPFLIQLLNALDTYFQSIYYVIQSPLP
jgi:hypothetical protein